MAKIKNQEDKFILAPPELGYVSERYVLRVPVTDRHLHNPWHLHVYAAELLERQLGDEVQVTSLKVKKPHLPTRTAAKILHREPQARLYVTVKF